MGKRKILGLSLGFAAYNYCFYLMLTWLPSYFTGALHLSLHQSVIYTSIPWFFATGSDLLFGGWLVDALVKRHANESLMRQLVLVGGMIVGLALLGPIFTRTPSAAVFWITLSICGLAASAPVAWTIPSLIAPRDTVGKVGGIMNFANQIAAICSARSDRLSDRRERRLQPGLHDGGGGADCRHLRIRGFAGTNRAGTRAGQPARSAGAALAHRPESAKSAAVRRTTLACLSGDLRWRSKSDG